MIKRTLCFTTPAYLSLKDAQLVVRLPEVEKSDLPVHMKKESVRTIPVEDIGVVVLDNRQITVTHGLLEALLENDCAVITCDSRSMPVGLMLPLCGNTLQSERFGRQIEASLPLKKQLWQQTIKAKISQQAAVLNTVSGVETGCMERWAADVRSGDADNLEGRAAAYYWKQVFSDIPALSGFTRGREGMPPNNLLNYGYAILRAVIARSLVSAGLLPTLGIHHHNRYNAYCLADDVMEPYRPYVDRLVRSMIAERDMDEYARLTKELKMELLSIPTIEVTVNGRRSPLMVAATQTAASLCKCYSGELRRIAYPEIN